MKQARHSRHLLRPLSNSASGGSPTRIRHSMFALLAGIAAFVSVACGSDSINPSGPTSSSHRYSVDLTVNLVTGNICKWAETDHGSLVVTTSPASHTGSVTNIINTQAQITQTSCGGTCTEKLLNSPHGPIDIQTVHAVAINPATNQVTVAYDAKVEDGQFQDTCGASVTTTGGTSLTVGTYLQFIDNGASQDVQYVDPATGQSARMVVTPIPN